MRSGNKLIAVCKGDWERADIDVVYLTVRKEVDVTSLIHIVPTGKLIETLREEYGAKDASDLDIEVLWD